MYGSQIRRIKKHVKRKIEATKIDALRRVNRTSKLVKIRNETLKERMGVTKTIIDCREEKQLILYVTSKKCIGSAYFASLFMSIK